MNTKIELPYDRSSSESILGYAMSLLDKSLTELYPELESYSGKGGLGEAVEKYHFRYTPNSIAAPDFDEAGVELKCTPLKMLSDGSMGAKERLVLNVINYIEEADKTFETSSFWHKNKLILLMFYLHENGIDPVHHLFKLIRLWSFSDEDLKIIRDDWNILHQKIISGHAHEISEGDTFYLAACPKGSTAGAEMRSQIGSDIKAQQRAYSLKASFMNQIILQSFLDSNIKHSLKLTPKRIAKLQADRAESIVSSVDSYKGEETFEQLVERRFQPFYGKTIEQIELERGVVINVQAKDFASTVCRTILGIKSRRIAEFEKAGILLKSIQVEANRDFVVESMSFPFMRYTDIAVQTWEESDWFETVNTKFLFAIFKKSLDGNKKHNRLMRVMFWNMPAKDIVFAESLWQDTKKKILAGDYNHFLTKSQHTICHVRPHATDSSDLTETPQGYFEAKKCFWLNNDYILDVIQNH